ncbi:hypothetical protein [Desulforamulus aquiferis]|uniref:DUF937 domain-containing protein n=1 Tax=Desulforamulus aquiferis TaxID=1397668 RepID=A0AAW7ZFP8_9FIRM|nr:hypothetical protein [Desulforamulus aquiferis]MDO7788083.1 hypothetical protein [Desulforamulus aquiferis]
MENSKEEERLNSRDETKHQEQGELLSQGLHESLLKLLNFQAINGADQNNTMILLALMNLLGIVNCMNKILPDDQKVRGTGELAGQIAGMLGGTVPDPTPAATQNPVPGMGYIDPGLLAALAGMIGGPHQRGQGQGEPVKGGIDPALLAALAGMLGGGQGAGGINPAALVGVLANMMGPGHMRQPEPPKNKEVPKKEEVAPQPEEKSKPVREIPRKEFPGPRGILKWDPRLG